MNEDREHRVGFPVDVETYNALIDMIPWGLKSQVFRKYCETLIETYKTDPQLAYKIVSGSVDITFKEKEE